MAHGRLALARGWQRAGHAITFGVTDANAPKARELQMSTGMPVLGNKDAMRTSEVLVISVPWPAIEPALKSLGDIGDRVVIDATNPLQSTDRGLGLACGFDDSGAETVARLLPGARVCKAMNQVGFEVMDKAHGYPVPPVMFVAGDDATAKAVVSGLVQDLGFDARDSGPLAMARLLEPYAMLWIDQVVAFGRNPRSAFAWMDQPTNERGTR